MTSALSRTLDKALDRTILPGYSKLGYALRRRWWENDPPGGALRGKVAVVTGASSGLGKATARSLARLGAVVHIVVRDLEKGGRAADEIRVAVPEAELALHRCDVSKLASVRAFAGALRGSVGHVDVLVHNAGTMPPARTETSEGHELSFATHVLGPVLLTEMLRPVLAGEGARVVLVSSGGMYGQRIPSEDPEFLDGDYSGAVAYARTKRMQVALTPLMQERWASEGIAVHSMHPGWADTPGVVESLPRFHRIMGPLLRDDDGGADTIVWLAASEPPPGGGQFWHDRAPRPEHYLPYTRDHGRQAERLWDYVLDALSLD